MLCRACGSEMVPFEYCAECNEGIHSRCSICKKENDKSVHVHYQEKTPKLMPIIGAVASVASGFSSLLVPM